MMYELMSDKPEKGKQNKDVFCSVFRFTLGLSIFVSASYTFSFEVFSIGLLTRYLHLGNGTELGQCDVSGNNSSDDMALDVSTLVTTMFNSLLTIAGSVLFATNLVVSHDLGKLSELPPSSPDRENIEKRIASANRNSCLLAILICFPVASFPLYYSSSTLQAFGQNPESSDIAQTFLRYSFLVPLVLYLTLVFEKILFSFRKVKVTTAIGFPIFVASTIFAVCMSLGCGFEPMGLEGLALPYMTGNVLTAFFYGIFLAFNKKLKRFNFFNFRRLGCRHWDQFCETVRTGLSLMVMTLNEMYIFFLLSILAGYLGDEQLARLNFVVQVYNFSFLVFGPMGEICSQEVRRRIGARYYQKALDKTDPGAYEVAKYGLTTAAICTAPITIISTVVYYCINNFKGELEDFMFPIFALGMYVHGLRYNLLQQQISLSDKVISNVVSGIAVALGLGVSVVLSLYTSLGTVGLGVGYSGGMLLAFFLLYVRWRYFSNPAVMQEVEEKGPSPHNRLWWPVLRNNNLDSTLHRRRGTSVNT